MVLGGIMALTMGSRVQAKSIKVGDMAPDATMALVKGANRSSCPTCADRWW
jgi:hypothetical protein